MNVILSRCFFFLTFCYPCSKNDQTALGNLQHIGLVDCPIAEKETYREDVFEALPQLITVDGLDR